MGSRTGAGALALALLLAGSVAPATAAAASPRPGSAALDASVPAEPGAVPDAELDATIHDEQLRLVTANAARIVATDQSTEGSDRDTLAADQQAYDQDRNASGAADALLASQQRATTVEIATLRSDRDHQTAARTAVASDISRLQTLAVGWYIGGAATPPPDAVGDLTGLEAASDADGELEAITENVEAAHGHDLTAAADAADAAAGAAGTLARDRRQEATLRTTAAERAAALIAAGADLTRAGSTLARATTALAGARAAQASAVSDFDGPEGSSPDPTPTILGRPALSAAQLAAWFDDSGYVAATSASIGQLAAWYISQGDAEGVRGDIAFAQAVVETGGFDSSDAVEDNNYAGIGHCDSCQSGLRFPSALAGVRGQLQLLRTYADADLTAAQLPSPPALPALDPSRQSRRGCCSTWNSLTGIWATDPDYGLTVLDLYQEILSSTLAGSS